MKIVIIGAGIGSLATANLLARDGHEVHIFEKNSWLGGRASTRKQDGFTFDTGPSWYLMPEVFRRYYELLGVSVDDELTLTRLSPAYKVFFEHDAPITITTNADQDGATFEAIEPGAGTQLKKYVEKSNKIYRLSIAHFLYSNFSSVFDIFNIQLLKQAPAMLRLALTPLHRYVSRFVKHRRLQQILEYPMVFLGTSPFKAPALYSLMSALDFKEGVFYPDGGIYRVINSLVAIGKRSGVHYHLNSPVAHINTSGHKTSGVTLATGKIISADIVISNADLHFTETELIDSPHRSYPESYWHHKEASPSALLLYIGVKGKLPQFTHHNLLFVDDWRENFSAIYHNKQPPAKASMYICKPSETDPDVAPEGHENIFVLIPLPAGNTIKDSELPKLKYQYLTQIKNMTGVDLAEHVVTESLYSPQDFSRDFHAWQSSMLGVSHRLTQSAFFRTKNKSKKIDNLYYVGANTLPGIGLPMCLISAELVYERITKEQPS